MSKINGNNLSRGNWLSKSLFVLSFIFLCLTGITLISKSETYDPISKKIISSEIPWEIAILWFVLSLITSYIAYRLAAGRRNPSLWKDKNLYDLLKHVALSGQARISFHSLRDQKVLLDKLDSIGVKKRALEDVRKFIREKIINDRKVFNVLQDDIIIQMIHNGKEWFWDGYGNKKTAQYFHEAEIIFDIKSSVDYMFLEVLEGLKDEDTEFTATSPNSG